MSDSIYHTTKQQALQTVCIRCHRCGRKDNLLFHHKYYAKDSIRPKAHREPGWNTILRWRKAITHPERFQVLCRPCHNRVEKTRKRKPVDISFLFDTNLDKRLERGEKYE